MLVLCCREGEGWGLRLVTAIPLSITMDQIPRVLGKPENGWCCLSVSVWSRPSNLSHWEPYISSVTVMLQWCELYSALSYFSLCSTVVLVHGLIGSLINDQCYSRLSWMVYPMCWQTVEAFLCHWLFEYLQNEPSMLTIYRLLVHAPDQVEHLSFASN